MLDQTEKEYLRVLFQAYREGERALREFVSFMSFKYKLTAIDKIDEDGNILYGKREE